MGSKALPRPATNGNLAFQFVNALLLDPSPFSGIDQNTRQPGNVIMAKNWVESVRDRGELRVCAGPVLRGGGWMETFELGVRRFNALADEHNLGVRLAATREQAGSAPGRGADVQVESADGKVSIDYAGATIARTVSGSIMHGSTLLLEIGGKVEKAFIFLPARPLVNTPGGQRPVGGGVKLLILVHEFVHACGLTNAEHGTADLFHGSPQVDPGAAPGGDRVRVDAANGRIVMPPLRLAGETTDRIRRLWH
jgi:hypothetical protein